MPHTYYEVIDTPISIEEVTNKVIRRECGAVTTFIGTVENLRKVDVRFIYEQRSLYNNGGKTAWRELALK